MNAIVARFVLGFKIGWSMYWRPLVFVVQQMGGLMKLRLPKRDNRHHF